MHVPTTRSVCLVSQTPAFQKLIENISLARREHCKARSVCVKGTKLMEPALKQSV